MAKSLLGNIKGQNRQSTSAKPHQRSSWSLASGTSATHPFRMKFCSTVRLLPPANLAAPGPTLPYPVPPASGIGLSRKRWSSGKASGPEISMSSRPGSGASARLFWKGGVCCWKGGVFCFCERGLVDLLLPDRVRSTGCGLPLREEREA